MPQVNDNPRNRLLGALSDADFALMQPHLEPVPLRLRERLQSANRRVQYVYFPERGLASVVAIGGGARRQAEVAIVGPEGMTGLAIVLGAERSACDVFMQMPGEGQRIAADSLRRVMDQSVTLLRCLLRYAYVYNVQAEFTALANAQGKIEERLARWLLMALDRSDDKKLVMTHEFLALMLGVRRAGVTVALGHLESGGAIETQRGEITVHNRDELRQCANGLYGAPEAEYQRLFKQTERRAHAS
jgi:CRP-like cAMP-binding protein